VLVALADEKGAAWWKAIGTLSRGDLFGEAGNASDAVQTITSGFAAQRSTGATFMIARFLSSLARAYANLGRLDEAWRSIDEAMVAIEKSKERWVAAEVHRTAGEIILMVSAADVVKAEEYFERALAVSRQQQAKSWELRAAMSLARLWRGSARAISGFVRAARYSIGTPVRLKRTGSLVQFSGRKSRKATITGTSPRASVSETSGCIRRGPARSIFPPTCPSAN
jgi:predicted ATPase